MVSDIPAELSLRIRERLPPETLCGCQIFLGHLAQVRTTRQHLADLLGQNEMISGRNQIVRIEKLGDAADIGCNAGAPSGHRFEKGSRQSLGPRWQHEQIDGIK